jgi:hypothetical protein
MNVISGLPDLDSYRMQSLAQVWPFSDHLDGPFLERELHEFIGLSGDVHRGLGGQ